MNKSLKVIFSLIILLFALQFVLIFILFNRYSVVSATRSFPGQGVSSERAEEIALNYLRHGIAGDVTFINEGGVPVYAVDISHENSHCVIYVHGETGEVVWLTRTEAGEDGYEGNITLPEILLPEALDPELD